MSTSTIPPLQPTTPVSSVSLTPSPHALSQVIHPTTEAGSVVELSTLARIQSLLQPNTQTQINAANTLQVTTQENALRQLDVVAATKSANTPINYPATTPLQNTALQNATETLLSAEFQTTLSSEALLSAIAVENANSVTNEINQAQLAQSTPSAPPSITQNNIAQTGSNNPPQAPIATNYATDMLSNPAITAAIAAYHLSDGMISHQTEQITRSHDDNELTVKGVPLLDPTEKIKEEDAKRRAGRQTSSLWKRVLKITNKLIQRFPNQNKRTKPTR
ncbi:hypothetical protein [Undibacterium sp. RuRC25W]|uniref:hypothetical protein n=1 Tax=Undibacterium sp. RuRC25W TaxID=3413047 RepID=UPI003BF356E1